MTDKDRETLLELSEVVRDLLDFQSATNRSLHALAQALKEQLPNLEESYSKVQKGVLFATRESGSIWKTSQRVGKIIDRLRGGEE
jgi:archaellum component FlaC